MRDGQAPILKKSAGSARGKARNTANRPMPLMPAGCSGISPTLSSRRHLTGFASPRPRIGQAPWRHHAAAGRCGEPDTNKGAYTG